MIISGLSEVSDPTLLWLLGIHVLNGTVQIKPCEDRGWWCLHTVRTAAARYTIKQEFFCRQFVVVVTIPVTAYSSTPREKLVTDFVSGNMSQAIARGSTQIDPRSCICWKLIMIGG